MPAPDAISLLRELVSIPSVNPSGNPGTAGINEQKIAAFLKNWTEAAGAKSRLIPVLPDRPNILAVWKPRRRVKTRIWFAPHTDTVSGVGLTVPPFTPTERRGRLYGRGACDTMGPRAAMLWAIAEWWRTGGAESEVEVTFAGLMGEEAGNDGARALAASPTRHAPDLVIVGEPTDLRVVTAHKGVLWLDLQASGRACHASAPERGENAIYALNEGIAVLRRDIIPKLAHHPHPLLGAATLSIGTIRGGSKVNIVPDSCGAEIDIRTTPSFTDKAVLAEIRQALRRKASSCRVTVQRSETGLASDPEHPLIRHLAAFSRGITGVPWFCDAAFFARRGWPAVAFGPGSISQAHTRDEFIVLKEVGTGVAAYLGFLRSL